MGKITAAEAARRLGVDPSRVRVLLRKGRLPADKLGKVWMIEERDLSKVRIRKPGRPRGKKSRG